MLEKNLTKVYNYTIKICEVIMLERILNIIVGYVDVPRESFNEDTNIFDLGIDSLRMLKIIMDVEDIYNIKFDDKEIVDIRSASDIEKIILEKIA